MCRIGLEITLPNMYESMMPMIREMKRPIKTVVGTMNPTDAPWVWPLVLLPGPINNDVPILMAATKIVLMTDIKIILDEIFFTFFNMAFLRCLVWYFNIRYKDLTSGNFSELDAPL